MATDDVGDLARLGGMGDRRSGEGGREFGEQPGPAEASAADDDAVASGGAIMASASPASKMSPFPSTGMVVTACFSSAMRFQSV